MVFFLLSSWNTVLDFDENNNNLVCREINNQSPSVTVEIKGTKAEIKINNVEPISVSEDMSLKPGMGSTIFDIKYPPRSGPYISLMFHGLYMSATSTGNVAVDKTRNFNWETFRIISQEDLNNLSHFLNNSWHIRSRKEIVSHHEISDEGDFTIRIGDFFSTNTEDLIEALRKSNPKEIILFHDVWKTEFLDLFRPAVYYCSFGRPEGFECLKMSISSLREYGKYSGEIKIFTEKDHEYIKDFLPNGTFDNIGIEKYTALDNVDYMSARFDTESLSSLSEYQPILYMDTDIIVKKPIEIVLNSILSDTIHQLQVFKEVDDITHDIYWGNELFDDDLASKKPNFGFSTGIIGFKNYQEVSEFFKTIREIIFRQSTIWGTRQIIRCFDQPVANYVLGKFASLGSELLSSTVINFDMKYNSSPDDKYQSYVDNINEVVVHFAGGVGAYDWKLEAMKRFLNRLEEGSSSDEA